MKIILLQDVRGLGKRHDIKEVRGGYAQNFLIAKKLAVQATAGEQTRRNAEIKKEQGEINKIKIQAEHLQKEPLVFSLKTGAQGEIFNSITKENIQKILEENNREGIKEIILEKPIRTPGMHKAIVHLKHGVHATINIQVH